MEKPESRIAPSPGAGSDERPLSPREQASIDSELDAMDAENLAAEAARRDRYFGFAGDEVSLSEEAGTYETSEPSGPGLGPIEYKSIFPPPPAKCLPRISGEVGPREARWRGLRPLEEPLHPAFTRSPSPAKAGEE